MNLFSNSKITYRFIENSRPTIDIPFLNEYQTEKLVSLRKSLENVSIYMKDLNEYIQYAEDNCNKSGRYGLTNNESAAIYLYTIQWNEGTYESLYYILNVTLRSGIYSKIQLWFPYLKLFSTALNKLPSIKKDLWRNIQGYLIDDYYRNKQFYWSNVISCSSNIDKIFDNFWNSNGKNTLFQINAYNGKNICDYSRFQNEDEVIILPGTKFSVIDQFISNYHFNGHSIQIIRIQQI